jgi:hypothetical protein
MLTIVLIILAIILFILIILYLTTKKQLNELQTQHEELLHTHKSTTIKHGMSFEQLFPFMNNYPYNTRNFRFIGTPIDGISFEDDNIVFVEFKTGTSALSSVQKKIKNLILKKKVTWKEIRDKKYCSRRDLNPSHRIENPK